MEDIDITSDTCCSPCICHNLYSHKKCLKNWIIVSKKTQCGACNTSYKIKKKKKPFCDWTAIVMSIIWEILLVILVICEPSSVDKIGPFIGMFSILIPWMIFSSREINRVAPSEMDSIIIEST